MNLFSRALMRQCLIDLVCAVGLGLMSGPSVLAQGSAGGYYVDDPYVNAMGQAASQADSGQGDQSVTQPSSARKSGKARSGAADEAAPSTNFSKDDTEAARDRDKSEQTQRPRYRDARRRAPAAPGAFQRYAQSTTGVDLQLFGSQFFQADASSFYPPSNTPVAGDYVVGPGDELLIRVWGAVDADVKAVVDRNGQISLPRVGTFAVAGVRADELDKYLRAKIGRVFTNFQLSVALGQLRAVQVYVVGQAATPGVYTLPSHSTMLTAVVAAGGPGPNGSMRKVGLRRNGQLVSELDIYDFLTQGDKARDLALQAGDVVVFYPAGPRIALAGVIDTPGIFELKDKEEPLSTVLKYAGGTTVLTNPQQVQLDRIDPSRPQSPRYVEPFKLDAKGLQKLLRDGDILTLMPMSQQFNNTVTLRGHVAYPIRMPFKAGMRIEDLIPSRDALIKPTSIQRKNELVQVQPFFARKKDKQDKRQTGGADTAGSKYDGTDAGDTADGTQAADDKSPKAAVSLAAEATKDAQEDAINWDYAVIERIDGKYFSTRWIPFNLGLALQSKDDPNNLELQPGDIVTIYGQDEMQVPQAKRSRLVSVEGEVMAPGIYQLRPGETLAQVIERAGGITPQAYLYGLEFSREDVRQSQEQNLRDAIERLEVQASAQVAKVSTSTGDSTDTQHQTQVAEVAAKQELEALRRIVPNGRLALELKPQMDALSQLPEVPLEAGDRIVVPSRPGFVTVVGAVANRNALLWREGRTAGDYLKLAGVQELADRHQAFIVRADGTVVHAADHSSFFGIGSGIEGEDIYPGDALVVPNQLDFETWGHALTRNLKDWSQILYQFGIGVSSYITIKNNLH